MSIGGTVLWGTHQKLRSSAFNLGDGIVPLDDHYWAEKKDSNSTGE